MQACGFRDDYATFVEEKNAIVLGVSPDNEAQPPSDSKTTFNIPLSAYW